MTDTDNNGREHGERDTYRYSKKWCSGCEEFVPGGQIDRHYPDGDCEITLGWLAPNSGESEWGQMLAALEEAGFSWSEEPGGQLLSRRSFRIYRSRDTEREQ